ncbi:MAG: autotransporter domain-containing protein [Candidatus Omnitrophica bacterium]|nr:autotransporter domain-containing protein [Candidatus Omnitrophota bacterium]
MVIAMVCSLSTPAFAADANGTWTNDGDGYWNGVANWLGNIIADGVGKIATFDTSKITVCRYVTLDKARTIGNLAFAANVGGDQSWYLQNGGTAANILTLNNGVPAPTITVDDMGTGAATISLVVAGVNGLTKLGAGTLILGGANTYTGATAVNAGTLKAGVITTAFGNNSAVTMANVAGAILDITGFDNTIGSLAGGGANGGNVILGAATLTTGALNTAATYDGVISGTGGLTKVGTNTQTLKGANTYTGATTVSAGTLKAGVGTTAFGNNSAVIMADVFGAILDITGFDNTIGSLTGGGANGGDVTLGAATLTVGGDNTSPAPYAGDITGTGGITKVGTGTLTFGGSNHTYTGATTITAGTLTIGGATDLAGPIAHNAGTLDLGTATLTLSGAGALGNYTQTGTPTLSTTILNATAAGVGNIASAGAMTTLIGSTLSVTVDVPHNTGIAVGTKWTILDGGAGGVVGVPGTVNSSNPRVSFKANAINNQDLELEVLTWDTVDVFATAATDSNARAAGAALDTIADPTGDMATVLSALYPLSDPQIAAALDTMVPEVDAGVIYTTATVLNNFVGVSLDRTEEVLRLACNGAMMGMSAGDATKLGGGWAKGYGSYLTQGMRNGIAGYDAWNAGTALGMDYLVLDTVTVGLSGGYAYGNVDGDANNANTNINSAQTTLYGGYRNEELPFFINTAGVFAYNWYNGRRDINIGNAIMRTANAEYGGQQYGMYVGGGYEFKVTDIIELTPLLSLQWNRLNLNSYTETRAGALSLSVASQEYDQLQSGLGARIAAPMEFEWGAFTPEIHGKWFYDFIGDTMEVTSTFTGGGPSFNANGTSPALNSFNIGGQLTFEFQNDISVIGVCDAEVKDEFFGIYGSVTLRYNF